MHASTRQQTERHDLGSTSAQREFFPTASIGTYLVVMATVITLPLILFVGYLMLRLEAEKRDDLQRETIEDVRVVSRNIDRRLQEIATSLNLLSQFRNSRMATSPHFRDALPKA